MKPYYVMIHFGGPYVTGFIAPQARGPEDAIRQIKMMIRVQIELSKGKDISESSDAHPNKLKEFMRSLKRPWRLAGRKGQPATEGPVVKVVEMTLSVMANYWLELPGFRNLCNQPAWSTPRKTI